MNESLEYRRKRLFFRCWHRGTRELDLIFGRFALANLDTLSAEELGGLEALLEISDPDIYCWLTGRRGVPPEYDDSLFAKLKALTNRAA